METKHISPVDMLAESSNKDGKPGKAPEKRTFIQKTIGRINIWLLLFIMLLVIAGGTVVVMYAMNKKEQNVTIDTAKLTQDTLNQLKAADSTVGTAKQTLTIESNAIFAGKILARSDLDVAGTLKVGGKLSIPVLDVTTSGSFAQLTVNGLQVSGDTKIGGALDVQKTLTVNGDVHVNGHISAAGISIDQLSITHINVSGPNPSITVGAGAGSGGTASIAGNDTAGVITINVGGLPPSGILGTVRFTTTYSATPHVVITPYGPGCSSAAYYVDSITNKQFVVGSTSTPAGATCKFNYIVIN